MAAALPGLTHPLGGTPVKRRLPVMRVVVMTVSPAAFFKSVVVFSSTGHLGFPLTQICTLIRHDALGDGVMYPSSLESCRVLEAQLERISEQVCASSIWLAAIGCVLFALSIVMFSMAKNAKPAP